MTVGSVAEMATTAAAIAQRHTGLDVRGVRPLERGVMHRKYLVEVSAGPPLLVRYYDSSTREALTYEPDLISALGERGLPVARVVGDSRDDPSTSQPYLIYEWIPGTPLDEWTLPTRAAEQVADFIDAVASIEVTGYGDLAAATVGRQGSWDEFMQSSFDEGMAAAREHGTFPAEIVRLLEDVRSSVPRFEQPSPARVAWADVREENVIVDAQGALAGIVDFEGSLAAEPALSLGYCRALYGEDRLAPQLLRAYRSRGEAWGEEARVDLYAVLRGVRLVRYAHLPLPIGGERTPVDQLLPGFVPALRRLAQS